MPATLWNKVNEYTVYAGWELGGAISTTTTKIGTDTTTMASSPHWLRSSVTGTTLTQVNDSPAGGNGSCWELKGPTTVNGTNNGYVEISGDHLDNVTAGNRTNYQVSFWFKFNFTTQEDGELILLNWDPFNAMGFYAAMMSGSTRKLRIRNKYNDSGGVSNVGSNANGDQFSPNTWYLFTYLRNGSQWKVLINGVQVAAFGGLTFSESSGISYGYLQSLRGFNANTIASVGKYVRFHGLFWGPTTEIDANGWNETRIAELYTAGTSVPATPVNYSASPMTASNAELVMPTISVTTSINIAADPATANAEIVNSSVSASVNYQDEFKLATAILTMPTLSFTFNDHTHNAVPAINLDGVLVYPLNVVAVQNINYSSDAFIASAQMEEHIISAGTGVSAYVDPITASALLVDPAFAGTPDKNLAASPMLASNAILQGEGYVPQNYRQLVKKHNPSLYMWGGFTSTISNDGYGQWGTISRKSGIQSNTSPSVMSYINNGKSFYIPTSAAYNSTDLYIDTNEAYERIKEIFLQNYGEFTIEAWVYPTSGANTDWAANTQEPPHFFIINNVASITFTDGSDGNYISCNTQSTNIKYRAAHISDQVPNNNIKEGLNEFGLFKLDVCGSGTVNDVMVGNGAIGYTGYSATNPTTGAAQKNKGLKVGQWNHVVFVVKNPQPGDPGYSSGVAQGNYVTKIAELWENNNLRKTETYTWARTQEFLDSFSQGLYFFPDSDVALGYPYFNEVAIYPKALSSSDISEHYNFITTFNPNASVVLEPFIATANLPFPSISVSIGIEIAASVATANITMVHPTFVAGISSTNSATALTASSDAVEPYFYGNPDALINASPATATSDIPQNIYRLDTAYYSYVQTNISPFRYVTFDVPNSNVDWGTDNDFGNAVPFTYPNGNITSAIFGLNNNALLTDGSAYTSSGLIMKESEYNDNWGSDSGVYHISMWFKKHSNDTQTNGIRIIANANSYYDNQYWILYQQNGKIKLELNNQTDSVTTFVSTGDWNLFDGSRYHVVLDVSQSGGNHRYKVYVNKILVLDQQHSNIHPLFKNGNTNVAPNTETNNHPRFAVGCLITPYAETNLSAIPYASQLYIDEVHWALTNITQTGVNNLYDAMPYKLNITSAVDPATANALQIPEPLIGLSIGISATVMTANGLIVQPSLTVDFDKNVNVNTAYASAEAIEPAAYFGDNITNITITATALFASADINEGVFSYTVSGGPMLATITMRNDEITPTWIDPYRLLVLTQTFNQQVGTDARLGYYGVGDIDRI